MPTTKLKTLREVFDQVSTHLLTQKTKATKWGTTICRLRAGDRSCAIGCLIPDDKYDPEWEGYPLSDHPCKSDILDAINVEQTSDMILLLEALQWTHDMSDPGMWGSRLKTLEMEFSHS